MTGNNSLFLDNQVNSKEEAYLLGILYADGTILCKARTNYPNTIKIDLQINDCEYMNKLNKILLGNIAYYDVKLNDKIFSQVRCSVFNHSLACRLINLGIVLNKTYSQNSFVFDNIPNNLKWHFIRGFFDGDGCITINKKGQYNFELCSHNIIFLESILTFLKKYVNTNSHITKGDGAHRIRIGGNKKVYIIKKYLYENCEDLFLPRKKKIFDTLPPQKIKRYEHILYHKQNKKYFVYIIEKKKRKLLKGFSNILESINYYNSVCENYNLKRQQYKGEELYEYE